MFPWPTAIGPVIWRRGSQLEEASSRWASALSSCEAEYYAVVALGMQTVAKELGNEVGDLSVTFDGASPSRHGVVQAASDILR